MLEGTEAWTILRVSDGSFQILLWSFVHTFRGREVNHVAVRLEHVDFLDLLDGLHIHLLKRGLQLLIVCAGALVDFLDFSSWCALASVYVC